jgi:hypothetical protein
MRAWKAITTFVLAAAMCFTATTASAEVDLRNIKEAFRYQGQHVYGFDFDALVPDAYWVGEIRGVYAHTIVDTAAGWVLSALGITVGDVLDDGTLGTDCSGTGCDIDDLVCGVVYPVNPNAPLEINLVASPTEGCTMTFCLVADATATNYLRVDVGALAFWGTDDLQFVANAGDCFTMTVVGDSDAPEVVKWTTDRTLDFEVFGDIAILNDNKTLSLGIGSDFSCTHDATDTTCTSTTGDFIIDSTDVDDEVVLQLGTDTNATAVEILNNTGGILFTVDGSGASSMPVDDVLWGFGSTSELTMSSDAAADFEVVCTADAGLLIEVPDNVATTFTLEDASNNDYILIDDSTGTERVSLGNTTDDPTWAFLGTGTIDMDGNLDTNLGLDVSGADQTFTGTAGSWTTTLADSALTQTGTGTVTLTGAVDVDPVVDGAFDVECTGTGVVSLDAVAAVNLTSSGAAATMSGVGAEVTATGAGDIDILATGDDIDMDADVLDALLTAGFSIDGDTASNVSVTTGDLTLQTITSGNLILSTTTAGDIDIDSVADVDIDGATLTADLTGVFSLDGVGSCNITTTTDLALVGTSVDVTGDFSYTGHKDGQVIYTTAFNTKDPVNGDWLSLGAGLYATIDGGDGGSPPYAAKHFYGELPGLKAGDEIVGVSVAGNMTDANSNSTLDCELSSTAIATPYTETVTTSFTPLTGTQDFNSDSAAFGAVTVADTSAYRVKCTATITDGADVINVAWLAVTINRK